MRSSLLLVSAFLALVNAAAINIYPRQLQDAPDCAAMCFSIKIQEAGSLAPSCSASDFVCLCNTGTFTRAYVHCVNDNCPPEDVQAATQASQSFCAAISAGLPLPTDVASSLSSISSSASSAVSSISSSASSVGSSLSVDAASSASAASASAASVASASSASIASEASASSANPASAAASSASSLSSSASSATSSIDSSISSVSSSINSRASSVISSLSSQSASISGSLSSALSSLSNASVSAVSTATSTGAGGSGAGYVNKAPIITAALACVAGLAVLVL